MAAIIRPHATASYSFRQSRYKNVPESPVRGIIVAPSGGGKSTLLVSVCVDLYRGVYNRIYVFSPNARQDVSQVWAPVEEYCRQTLRQEEPCLYEEFEEDVVRALIAKHQRITQMCRDAKRKELFQALFIVDDFADDERVMRRSASLSLLFTKGRRYGCSVWMSIQKYRVLSTLIRVNASDLLIFKLRSAAELQAIAEENSSAYGHQTTEKLILKATEEPYSFLWLNLRASDPRDLFWLRFEARLVPKSKTSQPTDEPAPAAPPRAQGSRAAVADLPIHSVRPVGGPR
jgi:hypothetical protein